MAGPTEGRVPAIHVLSQGASRIAVDEPGLLEFPDHAFVAGRRDHARNEVVGQVGCELFVAETVRVDVMPTRCTRVTQITKTRAEAGQTIENTAISARRTPPTNNTKSSLASSSGA